MLSGHACIYHTLIICFLEEQARNSLEVVEMKCAPLSQQRSPVHDDERCVARVDHNVFTHSMDFGIFLRQKEVAGAASAAAIDPTVLSPRNYLLGDVFVV